MLVGANKIVTGNQISLTAIKIIVNGGINCIFQFNIDAFSIFHL